jgi:hypothetical protein
VKLLLLLVLLVLLQSLFTRGQSGSLVGSIGGFCDLVFPSLLLVYLLRAN